MPEIITSRDNDQVKYLAKILDKTAFAKSEGKFVAEGVKLCMDAVDAGLLPDAVYYTKKAAQRWTKLSSLSCRQVEIADHVAEKLSGMKSSQGVFALCAMPAPALTTINLTGRYIALENVQDPANVGAIARSAAAFGFDGMLLGTGSADPFGQKAMRASMGAVLKLPIHQTNDLPSLLKDLTKKGMATAAAALEGAVDISLFAPRGGVVLTVGNEGQGLTEEAIAACSAVIKIPISGMESLNAAVAASILMWEYGGKPNG